MAPMAGERRAALCVARFYEDLAARLEEGARDALAEAGIDDVDVFDVPRLVRAAVDRQVRGRERPL